jgi:hypothetical protein
MTLLVVGFLAVYGFQKVSHSPDWQNFNVRRFVGSLEQLRYTELMGAILLIYLTYYLRSLRWYEFLRPVQQSKITNLLVATVLGFGAVAMFGRPGELVRPYMISKLEDTPVSGQVAVWILERFYDGVALMLLVGTAILAAGSTEEASGGVAPALVRIRHAGTVLVALTAVGVTLLVLYERNLKIWEPKLLEKLSFLPRRIAGPLREHLVSFAHGLASVRSARALILAAVYSALIWLTIAGAYWFTLQAFGPPLDDLSFSGALLVMGFAIGGSIIQLPGIGGGTQVFTILALSEIYGVQPEVCTSAAVVLWAMTFMAVLPLAFILCVTQGLTWGKLRLMTKGSAS